jgi:hypothetical protein
LLNAKVVPKVSLHAEVQVLTVITFELLFEPTELVAAQVIVYVPPVANVTLGLLLVLLGLKVTPAEGFEDQRYVGEGVPVLLFVVLTGFPAQAEEAMDILATGAEGATAPHIVAELAVS